MKLFTLGGLKLEGSDFTRPKPLLLLAYLALEGPKERRFLAELFWMDASDPLNRLSTALARLRKTAPGIIEADNVRVGVRVETDVQKLIRAVENGKNRDATDLYQGPFVEGIHLDSGIELEEWVYKTREYIAERVRVVHLVLADEEAAHGHFERAARRADAAYKLSGAAVPEPEVLERLHRLLLAGSSPYASELRQEAEGFGIAVATSSEEAKTQLLETRASTKPTTLSKLPSQATPFIGRERELAEVRRLLLDDPNCRLITLLGPGGIGKTRLALMAACGGIGAFTHGVFFVPLASIASSEAIVFAVASALSIKFFGPTEPEDQLLAYLHDKESLLVLDNFEHLLGDVAFVCRVLAEAPHVKLLVTSQERLNLSTETTLVLKGMGYPEGETSETIPHPHHDALKLLMQRAKLARGDRVIEEADLIHAARICQLVDGMPLAIVLAAGWLEMLSFKEVAEELAQNLDLLESEARDLPERQRSIRAAFDYSWKRLSVEEQQMFLKLSVFRGGFTRQAAQSVAGAGLHTLRRLVEKSLLFVSREWRYGIHGLLRQYGEARLTAAENLQSFAARYASYYLDLLVQHADDLVGPKQQETMQELLNDFDNIQAAWRYGAQHELSNLLEKALRPLFELYVLAGRYREGQQAFYDAANLLTRASTEHSELLARLKARKAAFLAFQGHFLAAKPLLEKSLSQLELLQDKAFIFETLGHYVLLWLGEIEAAQAQLHNALSLYRQIGDMVGMGRVLYFTAAVLSHTGDYLKTEKTLKESYSLLKQQGDPRWLARCTAGLGVAALEQRHYLEARVFLEEAIESFRTLRQQHDLALAQSNLGETLLNLGDLPLALEQLQQARALLEEVGDPALTAEVHFRLGHTQLLLGDRATAEAHFRQDLQISVASHLDSSRSFIGFADLIAKSDPDHAIALYLFVMQQAAVVFSERQLAEAHLKALNPSVEQLRKAQERASSFQLEEITRQLLTKAR